MDWWAIGTWEGWEEWCSYREEDGFELESHFGGGTNRTVGYGEDDRESALELKNAL